MQFLFNQSHLFQIPESADISSELIQLINKMLAKKPQERITLQEIKVGSNHYWKSPLIKYYVDKQSYRKKKLGKFDFVFLRPIPGLRGMACTP